VLRSYKILWQICLATAVLPQLCNAQNCESLNASTPEAIVSALDHGDIKTEDCSRIAFRRIEQLPKDESIPILIRHLGFKRPPSYAPHGLRSPYPAVDSLASIGLPAEPLLIEFLAQNQDEVNIERANAIEALALIRHSDVVTTIRLLRQRSAQLAGTPASAHLEAAAQYMLKTYCRRMRQWCEKRLRESD
jgi:hypothetical protein